MTGLVFGRRTYHRWKNDNPHTNCGKNDNGLTVIGPKNMHS